MANRFIIVNHTPGQRAIVDTHQGNARVAFAFADHAETVRAALEGQGNAKADAAKASNLVRSAFMEGWERKTDDVTADTAWHESTSRRRARALSGSGLAEPSLPVSDQAIFTSPSSTPIQRMAAHGRIAMKDV